MKEDKNESYWEQDVEDEAIEDQSPVERTDKETKDETTTWTAQEYVHLDKGPWWFVIFAVVVLGLIALDILVLHAYTLSVLVVVMAVALIVYIRRPPREIAYSVSSRKGLTVGDRLYHFSEFKSFGVIQDGDHHSIMLIPVKRFAPGVSVYFPEESGEQIVDLLGQQLPMENLKLDIIDVLVRKLRL